MAVTSSNLVLGPAEFYIGVFGATEPPDTDVTGGVGPDGAVNAPNPAVWTDVGGTDGGVNFEVDSTYTDLTVDQILMSPGTRLTDVKIQVAAKLAEITLENINFVLNQIGLIEANTGYTTMDIDVDGPGTQPKYAALLIDGWAPYTESGNPALRRIIVRKAVSQTKAQLAYDKKTQQGLDCTFGAYYVTRGIKPVHIVDQTA